LRAELDGACTQVRREVVVIALEPVAGDPEARGERVKLLEIRVADEVTPVPERQSRVRVFAQLVDQDGHETRNGDSSHRLSRPKLRKECPF